MANQHRSSWRIAIWFAIKVGVSVGLLALLFGRTDVASLWSRVRAASTAGVLLALTAFFVNVLIGTWRWRLLLRAQKIDVSARWLLGSMLVASFFNNFLPTSVGGDVVRIADTARLAQSKTRAGAVVLFDRAVGVLVLTMIAAIATAGVAQARSVVSPRAATWLWLVFLGGASFLACLVIFPSIVSRILAPVTVVRRQWATDRIARLVDVFEHVRRAPAALAGSFFGAVAGQIILVLFYFAVSLAVGVKVSLADFFVLIPLSMVVQLLPISISGFGIREATFTFYFQRIGQGVDSALLVSLLAQALIMLVSLTGAVVYVTRGAGVVRESATETV